ncbi:MAG TPA: hypothetical protein VHM00_13410 [Caldimonas sp.]|jgi:hypothetical protein|nr:hypothetical protein [Caldimonas sp.]HEX2542068.1 hypothetical protein [Caldimonas sp.]
MKPTGAQRAGPDLREPTEEGLAATLCNTWHADVRAWAAKDEVDRRIWLEVGRAARAALGTPAEPTLPLHSRREQQVYRGGWIAGFESREKGLR